MTYKLKPHQEAAVKSLNKAFQSGKTLVFPEGLGKAPKTYKLVEKKNPLAVHGLFDSLGRAERHLSEVIPVYVKRGYFMDKTLTADSFEVVIA